MNTNQNSQDQAEWESRMDILIPSVLPEVARELHVWRRDQGEGFVLLEYFGQALPCKPKYVPITAAGVNGALRDSINSSTARKALAFMVQPVKMPGGYLCEVPLDVIESAGRKLKPMTMPTKTAKGPKPKRKRS